MEPASGTLWEGVLPGVLRRLYVGRATGRLLLERGAERHGLRFQGGHILNAETSVREDRMGELLVARGRLTAAALKRATGFALRDGKRVGAVLVEQGLLDAEGLEEAVSLHVQHVLQKVFPWNEGAWAFRPEADPPLQQGDLTLRLSTGDLILQAARSVQDPDVVRYNLGDLGRRLALSSDPLLRFQHISLSPVDGYVISRVDGSSSARQVVSLIPLPEEQVHRSLFGLLSTGVIDFLPDEDGRRPGAEARVRAAAQLPREPPPQPPEVAAGPPPVEKTRPLPFLDQRRLEILGVHGSLSRLDHFELLRIGRDATAAQVREAYFELARRFHPDAHHEPALSDLRDPLEQVFRRLGEAYEVLSEPEARARYERELEPPSAPRS
jgi:hypothetical protein